MIFLHWAKRVQRAGGERREQVLFMRVTVTVIFLKLFWLKQFRETEDFSLIETFESTYEQSRCKEGHSWPSLCCNALLCNLLPAQSSPLKPHEASISVTFMVSFGWITEDWWMFMEVCSCMWSYFRMAVREISWFSESLCNRLYFRTHYVCVLSCVFYLTLPDETHGLSALEKCKKNKIKSMYNIFSQEKTKKQRKTNLCVL